MMMIPFYTLLYGLLTLNVFIHLPQEMVYVTDISVVLLFLLLFCIWLPSQFPSRFAKLLPFALKTLFFPVFGLSCVVFVNRYFFQLATTNNWIFIFLDASFVETFPRWIILTIDALLHRLPPFVLFQILYRYQSDIQKIIETIPWKEKLINTYTPYGIILIWNCFHNPFRTYAIPFLPATWFGFYFGIPIILTFTSLLWQSVIVKRSVWTYYTPVIDFYFLGVLFGATLLGNQLFGTAYLYQNVISLSTLFLACLLIVRLLPPWVFSSEHVSSLYVTYGSFFTIPLFTFILSVIIAREIFFVTADMNPQILSYQLLNAKTSYAEQKYSLYILVSYTLPLVISLILFYDFPKNLSLLSPVRTFLQSQCSPLQRTWQIYGGLLVGIGYGIASFITKRKNEDELIFVLTFWLILTFFTIVFIRPLCYRMFAFQTERTSS